MQTLYAEDSSCRDDWIRDINEAALIASGMKQPMVLGDRYQVWTEGWTARCIFIHMSA